uniref:Uncharacterized protein n=1 Tax=Hyaloperonospora arabidopsidis (strain Emoy2) TaxID=559515 RepID=M4BKE5_HYAAE
MFHYFEVIARDSGMPQVGVIFRAACLSSLFLPLSNFEGKCMKQELTCPPDDGARLVHLFASAEQQTCSLYFRVNPQERTILVFGVRAS